MGKVTMCDIEDLIADYHTDNGITKDVAARRMGINYSTYKRKTRPHDEYEITVRELIPFIRAHDNDFRILDLIEETLGRVAFRLPKTKETISVKDIANMIRQFSESIKTLVDIIEGNKIDKEEDVKLGKHLINLNQQINEMQAKLMNKY